MGPAHFKLMWFKSQLYFSFVAFITHNGIDGVNIISVLPTRLLTLQGEGPYLHHSLIYPKRVTQYLRVSRLDDVLDQCLLNGLTNPARQYPYVHHGSRLLCWQTGPRGQGERRALICSIG